MATSQPLNPKRADGDLEQRVLVTAPTGQDAQVLCRLLDDAGIAAKVCSDLDELCRQIERGAAAAIVAEEVFTARTRELLAETLSYQPEWSDFPLIVMAASGDQRDLGWTRLNKAGGSEHAILLQRPLRKATLVSSVRVALQSRARQYQVREELLQRRRGEEVLRTVNEQLEQRVAERTAVAEGRARALRRSAAELSQAEHRERKRLAKLLHDELQQLLVGARILVTGMVDAPLDELRQRVVKIDELLRDCLNTSRSLTKELSPPVLQHGTLTEVIQWLGQWFGEKHGLRVVTAATGETVPAPEHLRVFLYHAIRELLFNVVKHSGKMEARVVVSLQDRRLTVQVEDQGEGFDPDAVEIQLRQPESFGLFNIHERLESLGGCLEINRSSSGGACFGITVPMGQDAAAPPAAHPARAPRGRTIRRRTEGRPIRLLVVDDHAVVREGFVGLLNSEKDFEVVGQAVDGKQAVEQADALRPDVIIMDVNMPVMDGIEATRRIKQRQVETIVVGLSLHDEESVAHAISEAGADAYISKNAPTKDLVNMIRRVYSRDLPCESPGVQ
ncbi:MAG: response regulator [Pirellulales bacterium]